MGIKLDNAFALDVPPEQAWLLLNDVERIAPYVPGAKLTASEGDDYHGIVSVKLGPIIAQYKGTATITSRDEAARRLTLAGKGRDVRGQGTASADLVATVHADGTGSRVHVETDVQVTGKVAQLGRGIMQDVSARLIDQFVANLVAGEGVAKVVPPAPSAGAAESAVLADVAPRLADAPRPSGPQEVAPIDLMKLGSGAILTRNRLVGAWMAAVLVLLGIIAFR